MNQKDISDGTVSLEYIEDGLAVISMGSEDEAFVSFTEKRMNSLGKALDEVAEKDIKGLIIIGARPDMFCVGADLSLIQSVTDPKVGAAAARNGQAVFDKIANLPCITIAAISGPCVGGGCEMVLACDVRLISDHKASSIGLPETKLGILPGFGGTQRLPRLLGLPKALDIILAGKILRSQQALKCGLVHEVIPVTTLRKRAENIARGKVRTSRKKPGLVDRLLTNTGIGRNTVKNKAAQKVQKQTKGFYPAQPAALQTCVFGLEKGLKAGLEREANELGRLIVTPESKSLVKLFFLTEASKAIGKPAKDDVDQTTAVVVGAGVMGAGIAGVLVKNECSVVLKDTSEEGLSRGKQQIAKYLGKLRYLTDAERSFILNRVETTTGDSSSIGNSNFAIEAIFEDLDLKKQVLGDLAQLLPEDAIISTNTSSLSVSKIAEGIKNPERVVGMHFFNPVEKMPLVEIVRGEQTSDKCICFVAALATKLGKFPIVVNDVPGFLVNRILTPYLNEAAYLLQDGFSVTDIDKAATKFGMPMGPVRLLDEVGLDVATHVVEIMKEGYGDRMDGPSYAKKMLAAGRKGKKNKAGFYDYQDKKETPYEQIRDVLEIQSSIKNPDLKSIEDRLVYSLINEAVRCLDEGVAGIPGEDAAKQIDLGTVMGTGFPPFRGGLLNYAQSLGANHIHNQLKKLQEKHGNRYQSADGIAKRASSNSSFYAPT